MSLGSNHVLIAGAGPVGLVSALLLARAGVPLTIVERETALPQDMRASTFHAATLDILADLGLDRALVAQGTAVRRWQYLRHDTGSRIVFDMNLLANDTAHPYRLQCEQFRLTRLALQRLQAYPHCRVHFGQEVVALEQSSEGVSLTTRSAAGDTSRHHGDYLLACDGGRSGVRKAMGLAFDGLQFPKTSITLVLDHPFHREYPGLEGVNYVWTAEGHYSLMRLRDLWRFSYSPHPEQSVEEALSEAAAQASIQRVFPRVRPYRLLQRNYYTLQQRCLENFVHSRVLFAGDAAHLNSPAGGMGMNSGLQDARCLVEHLLPVLGGEPQADLARYDRRRRTIAIEEVQRLSARNYQRHRETDADRREVIWRDLQATAADPVRHLDYLRDAAMLTAVAREASIA